MKQAEKRGQRIGTKLLKELLESKEIVGFTIENSEAVIFPGNIASQKAFENAGFLYHHTHEDGNAMYYSYAANEDDAHITEWGFGATNLDLTREIS